MSRRNSLEAKKKRREERENHAIRLERKRALQARLNYLAYAPPETFDDLGAEVDKAFEEANEGL